MNAFEHYENPFTVASEIMRVLKPGGRVVIQTAFLQPVHEAPRHFFNATKYGIRSWFSDFKEIQISVTPNFSPGHALAWTSHELLQEIGDHLGPGDLRRISKLTVAELAKWWEDQSAGERDSRWDLISSLPQQAQEKFSAGFEAWFAKPD